MAKNVVVIAGPTASGKSALALALAEQLGGVIINADSQQRYRDLPILTAQPSAAEQARAPHRLFGDLGPEESGSAGQWAALAAEASAAEHLPIIVGGTGLYLRALMEGIADIPEIDPDIRAETRALLLDIGNTEFHQRLVARDAHAVRLAPGDTQRNLRAYEVIEATGTSLWDWQQNTAPVLQARYFKILLLPPRADQISACDARLAQMIDGGAVEEVRVLRDAGITADAPAMKVLGARPLADYLGGLLSLEQAVSLTQTATRQYAKRQGTWFRNQFQADLVVPEKYREGILSGVVDKVGAILGR